MRNTNHLYVILKVGSARFIVLKLRENEDIFSMTPRE
jgi:hypothetical protein